jgi:hypothetical protein
LRAKTVDANVLIFANRLRNGLLDYVVLVLVKPERSPLGWCLQQIRYMWEENMVENKPLKKGDTGTAVAALHSYLQDFGHIPSRRLERWVGKLPAVASSIIKDWETFDDATEETVRLFQRTFSLPETGEVDGSTLQLMLTPRCGVPDIPGRTISTLSAPVCGWHYRKLRYHIIDTLPQIGSEAHKKGFVDALQKWANIAGMTITEGPVGSEIQSFNYDGDGCGGTYAFTYFPCSGAVSGDARFDDRDCWSVATPTPSNRVDFLSVALHELGHAVGLGHSNVRSAVMWPYFALGEMRRDPTSDDIQGILALYPQSASDQEALYERWASGELQPILRGQAQGQPST